MLHGEVKVNDKVIMIWQAVNKGNHLEYGMPRVVNRYECCIEGTTLDGDRYFFDFDIFHRFGDGSHLLVEKIMSKTNALLKDKL